MKGTDDISVSEVNDEAMKICVELAKKGYPSIVVGLIGQMVQASADMVRNRDYSDWLLEKQVNNVVERK